MSTCAEFTDQRPESLGQFDHRGHLAAKALPCLPPSPGNGPSEPTRDGTANTQYQSPDDSRRKRDDSGVGPRKPPNTRPNSGQRGQPTNRTIPRPHKQSSRQHHESRDHGTIPRTGMGARTTALRGPAR
jgi:hypothetical protein